MKYVILGVIILFLLALPYRIGRKRGYIFLVPLLILIFALFTLKTTFKLMALSIAALLLIFFYLFYQGSSTD
jgi:hypothetical protein